MVLINHKQHIISQCCASSNCYTMAPSFNTKIDSRMDFSLHNIAIAVNRK